MVNKPIRGWGQVHHEKHYLAYINNLNTALQWATPQVAQLSLEDLNAKASTSTPPPNYDDGKTLRPSLVRQTLTFRTVKTFTLGCIPNP